MRKYLLVAISLAISLVGCTESRVPVNDDAAAVDAGIDTTVDVVADDVFVRDRSPSDTVTVDVGRRDGTEDAFIADAQPSCDPAIVGTACSDDSECAGGFCLATTKSALIQPVGVCSCNCTIDDPATRNNNEDSCPDHATLICGRVPLPNGQQVNGCLRKCVPRANANDCNAGIACDPATTSLTNKFDMAVCLFATCKTDVDCPMLTASVCDPAQNGPNNSNPGCSSNARCFALTGGPAPTGRCIESGVCNSGSGLCLSRSSKPATFSATASVGDPCVDDTECNATQQCILPAVNKVGDPVARNGYCVTSGCAFVATVPQLACDATSTCFRTGQSSLCLRTCDPQDTGSCRGHPADKLGDYECQSWNNFNQPGAVVAEKPICLPATYLRCADLQGMKVGCSALGVLPNNPTQMSCRRLDGTPTVNPYDPLGYCLDETGSAP